MEYVLNLIGLQTYSFKRALSPFVALGQHIYDHFIPHQRNNYHPHILGHRSLALMSALMVTVKIFTIAVLAWGPVVPAFSSAITVENIINLTNQSRAQFNESALTENSMLDQAAQAKANDMLARGYFAHITPDGKTPWSFITAAGYNYLMAGENLAVNFTDSEDVETAWMNSPDHRANLLNKDFQNIGIGVSQGTYQNHNAIFVVQEFGTPADQQVALNNIPTPVQSTAVPAPTIPTTVAKSSTVSKTSASAPTQVKAASSQPVSQPVSQPANSLDQAPSNVQQLSVVTPVVVVSGDTKLDGENIDITAKVTGPAVKVLAYFGQQAVMLSPKDQTIWTGSVSMSSLTQQSVTVRLEASDMQGKVSTYQLADFSPTTIDNFNLPGTTPATYVTFLGQTFDPKAAADRFYLFLIAGLLASLILAIGLKRHVQHLSLIVNSSFAVIFIALLVWVG